MGREIKADWLFCNKPHLYQVNFTIQGWKKN